MSKCRPKRSIIVRLLAYVFVCLHFCTSLIPVSTIYIGTSWNIWVQEIVKRPESGSCPICAPVHLSAACEEALLITGGTLAKYENSSFLTVMGLGYSYSQNPSNWSYTYVYIYTYHIILTTE